MGVFGVGYRNCEDSSRERVKLLYFYIYFIIIIISSQGGFQGLLSYGSAGGGGEFLLAGAFYLCVSSFDVLWG